MDTLNTDSPLEGLLGSPDIPSSMAAAMRFLEANTKLEMKSMAAEQSALVEAVAADQSLGQFSLADRLQDMELYRKRLEDATPTGVTRGTLGEEGELTEDVSVSEVGFDASGRFRFKGFKKTHVMGATYSMVELGEDDGAVDGWITPASQQPIPAVPVTDPAVGSMLWFNPNTNAWNLVPVTVTAGDMLFANGAGAMPTFQTPAFAADDHDHADLYSVLDHEHADLYQPLGSYALSGHDHNYLAGLQADIPEAWASGFVLWDAEANELSSIAAVDPDGAEGATPRYLRQIADGSWELNDLCDKDNVFDGALAVWNVSGGNITLEYKSLGTPGSFLGYQGAELGYYALPAVSAEAAGLMPALTGSAGQYLDHTGQWVALPAAPEPPDYSEVYAALGHDHAAVYQPLGSYAASDHDHDYLAGLQEDIPKGVEPGAWATGFMSWDGAAFSTIHAVDPAGEAGAFPRYLREAEAGVWELEDLCDQDNVVDGYLPVWQVSIADGVTNISLGWKSKGTAGQILWNNAGALEMAAPTAAIPVAAAGAAGLMPALTGSAGQYLDYSGSWAAVPVVAAGAAGLMPKLDGSAGQYLDYQGNWTQPPAVPYGHGHWAGDIVDLSNKTASGLFHWNHVAQAPAIISGGADGDVLTCDAAGNMAFAASAADGLFMGKAVSTTAPTTYQLPQYDGSKWKGWTPTAAFLRYWLLARNLAAADVGKCVVASSTANNKLQLGGYAVPTTTGKTTKMVLTIGTVGAVPVWDWLRMT